MQKNIFIGREAEQEILQEALDSHEAEMVAVIGRRRVGKTFLIKEFYKEKLVFKVTGLQDGPLEEQLENFAYEITKAAKSRLPISTPRKWLHAFMLLIDFLEGLDFTEKKVVFLDELSWLSTHKSGFLRALGFFWNSWAVNQNIVVVICGSAASWMIQKVVNNRGGLHNRITRRIFLKPFTLAETKKYLESRHIHFKHFQIVQLYMTFGGVPHYLKEIKAGKSAVQNIDAICFAKTGLLKDEFDRLYPSLFDHAEQHIAVIRALAKSRQGMTRQQIIKATKLPENGATTRILDELVQSDFVSMYYPLGKKKKGILYRLTDEYSLFYLHFMENKKQEVGSTWQHLSQTQAYKIWCGYAYENLCFKHLPQIKKALSIAGVYSVAASFYKKGTPTAPGAQIDLLLDRNDKTINVFEVKFHTKEFTVSKDYAQQLQRKLDVFEETTKTRKQLFLTLITTFGLKHNQHSLGLVEQVLTFEDLFEE